MENIEQRTREIVEDLRADIDFELDDVIAKIVSGLPEDYFKSLSRNDQLMQLKALLAMGVCNLDQEIMIRSESGRHIGVVSRQNYPGLLANIVARLPDKQQLIGAKVFTSKDHDFIIDLFEFESDASDSLNDSIHEYELEDTLNRLNVLTQKSTDDLQTFLEHYRPNSPILKSPEAIAEHVKAYDEMSGPQDAVVRWTPREDNWTRVTISTGSSSARDVFRRTAAFLGQHDQDVEQASLHDFTLTGGHHVAIATFLVSGKVMDDVQTTAMAADLKSYLLSNE